MEEPQEAWAGLGAARGSGTPPVPGLIRFIRNGPRHGALAPGPRPARLSALAFVAGIMACRGGPEAARPLPAGVDADVVAREASAATMPENPTQISFGFRLREADLRFSGRGVARIQPPYRVRIDLFSQQGDGLFRAALVGSDLRVPPGVPRELAPPPALLWAALGVFRPDADLHLLEGRLNGEGAAVLRYDGGTERDLRFTLADGFLTRAEIREGGRVVEEVDLALGAADKKVVETTYRNYPLFLELTFTLESAETVDSFPPDIWYPGRLGGS